MLDKLMCLFITFTLGLLCGITWVHFQQAGSRHNARVYHQAELLQTISDEAQKGYDFNIHILDKTVSFQPMKDGNVRVRQ